MSSPNMAANRKVDLTVSSLHTSPGESSYKENQCKSNIIYLENGQLSYISQDCRRIPSILANAYGMQTKSLDLSYNDIRSLETLEDFSILEQLILDNNELTDNANFITDLDKLLNQLVKCYPNLTYLSLLGNPACPDQLSNMEKDEDDYQRYRYYVIHKLPMLNFLDSTPVTARERAEAKRIGAFMRVIRPVESKPFVDEDTKDVTDGKLSPLPQASSGEGTHRGAYGVLRHRYTGKIPKETDSFEITSYNFIY
ncbi:leucine-rich melanocyte differentiation-associated protein-like isoform X2 [Tachypleus tridentatus]|uniref:leucine-rich melanocyte differentiation-associated protein-like isoform X2 n=1 Tax=Tachypleus tridentatus TaxID=6853 RepID=UPI003FD5D562